MNAKQIEVHEYFKAMHPEALILYHLPGHYMMLGDDVNRALKSIPQIKIEAEGVGSLPDNISYLSALSSDGTEVQLIEYRNDEKVLDLPDIRRLREEKDSDY